MLPEASLPLPTSARRLACRHWVFEVETGLAYRHWAFEVEAVVAEGRILALVM